VEEFIGRLKSEIRERSLKLEAGLTA
jgi:hypothetical protein